MVGTADPNLEQWVADWLAWDGNATTRAAVAQLVERVAWSELQRVMAPRLEFGTAGIRGRMGPGFGQLNDLVIVQTTQGLLSYLEQERPDLRTAGVVLSYDGRHNSRRWARLASGVFLRADIPVYLFQTTTPTPFVPFTVVKVGAAAGVMVTASHNPKWDNGYKVYWANGAQILSPHDKHIQAAILANLVPQPGAFDEPPSDHPLLRDPMDRVRDDYFSVVTANVFDRSAVAAFSRPVVYTAMHGVGHPYVQQAWAAAGFSAETLVSVAEQQEPDPEFSTVDFPNPEEGASALDLSFQTADRLGADYILANDPDADRLGVAQRQAAPSGSSWRILSGNEIGALLGWWLLHTYRQRQPTADMARVHCLASTVSSKILNTLCTREGAVFTETLTGFKHMGNESDQLIKQGDTVLFAFEEAIGFMCGTAVIDKDGVSAAATVGELIAHLHLSNRTLLDKLKEIYLEYGYHYTLNSYYLCYEPRTTDKIFARIRNYQSAADTYPTELAGHQVINVRDLTTGYDSTKADKRATLPTSKSSHMITFWLDNGVVITLRTSGTEPKIKYYTEYCAKPGLPEDSWKELEDELRTIVDAVVSELLQPQVHGLKPKPV